MNIKLLDKNYAILGEIDDFYSLVWTRKYFDVGEFQLHAKPNAALQQARYLYRDDTLETGRINRFDSAQTETGERYFILSGKFLEGFLSDRIITPVYTSPSSRQVGMIIGDLITRNMISPVDVARRISNVRMGSIAATTAVPSLQVTYDNLKEYIYELCLQYGCSVRAVYDFMTNEIEFQVWNGLDRTQDQSINSWAVFSDTYDNINQIEYYKDESDYRNFAYVAGEDSGTSRVIVEINNVGSGEDRKELYVDARDLQSKDEDDNTIPAATYRNILEQRGSEKLSTWLTLENVNCSISVYNKSLVYRQDYDLGDICTVQYNELGITVEKRITECTETWESGALSVETVFGEDYLNFWNLATHK